MSQTKHGRYSRFTELDLAEIRAAHQERKQALRKIKYLMSKHGLNTQRFSQVALGKIDGRQPRPVT